MSHLNFFNNPLNITIKEPNWKRLIQKLDMAYYHCRMPVLENVNIALSEVLEVRGSPLQEEELWALLGQSITAIEDLFLTGKAHKNGIPEYTITPTTLQCTAMGRILICTSSEDESDISLYKAPEVIDSKEVVEDYVADTDDMERTYVYSLGKTIWFAASYNPNLTLTNFTKISDLTTISPVLTVLLETMVENDIRKRLSYPGLVKICLKNVPVFTKQLPIRKIIIMLHQEVLGSLPEGEILRQVEQDVARENTCKEFDFDQLVCESDVSANLSKRQSCCFNPKPDSTEYVYGHRLEFSFKDNLVSCESEFPVIRNNTGPRERWKKAFMKVSEKRRQEEMQNSMYEASNSKSSTRWENYKAKDSIVKVCEELTERRKMLELLRMNINLGPSVHVDVVSNSNFSKGIKPKTLAELVMMLKKPKLVRVKSSSSLGSSSSAGSIRSAKSIAGRSPSRSINSRNATPTRSIQSAVSDKGSFKIFGKHSSNSLRKNVITANLKKNINSGYYSTNDCESLSQQANWYCWNPSSCTYYGPEFVIRSTLFPLKMCLMYPAQDRTNNSVPFKATVILLSGQQLGVTSNTGVSGRQLFHSIAHQIALPEPNLFGLAIRKGDEYLFVDSNQKLNKIKLFFNPTMELMTLYLRIKYFLPDMNFLNIVPLKHLYYLQLRRNLLEGKTFCSYEKAISLAGLALQAEFGDYNQKLFGCGDYFLLEHYIPDFAIQFFDRDDSKMQIFHNHLENFGKTVEEAENEFIQAVLDLTEYGYHFYTVLQDKNDPTSKVWISISAWGVDVFEDQDGQRSMCQNYSWSNIRQISFSKRYFTLVPKSHSLTGKPVKYMFFIGDYIKSSSLFSMAVGHHRFFVKPKTDKTSSISNSMEELDLIPFTSITNNENASEDEDIEYKINQDSITETQEYPKSWISNFTTKYFEGVRHSNFGSLKKTTAIRKLTKSHSTSEEEPIDSFRKEYGISIKPLPQRASSFISSFNSRSNLNISSQNSQLYYDDVYEVLLLRSNLENGLGLMLTCGSDEATLLRGTFVESVLPDGPCAGKISTGDRLITVNGERVEEKNYLEVVDIIKEITGDVLLTLIPDKPSEAKPSMPSLLEDDYRLNAPETKFLEKAISNGNSKFESSNRNLNAVDSNGYRSLDKNDNEINNNSTPAASPQVPIRRRRKNTYKSSLSTSSNGEVENGDLTVGGTSIGTSSDGSGDANEPLTSKSRPPEVPVSPPSADSPLPANEITEAAVEIEEMGTLKDSLGRRKTFRDETRTSENHENSSGTNGSSEELVLMEEYQVTLQKVNESFGFRVAERYQFGDVFKRGIFVHSLISEGAAEVNGRIKSGDQLVKINGTSTEGLSYKEGVGLLKKSPRSGTLCFQRYSQPLVSEVNRSVLDEDADNMISKWGRRGSRTSLSSQTNSDTPSPTTAVRNLTSPIYARSISQVILPTVAELRALAENETKEEISTRAVIHSLHSKDGTLGFNNFVDISSRAYKEQIGLSNGHGEDAIAKERSSHISNGNGHLAGSNALNSFNRSVSAPLLEVPPKCSPNSSVTTNEELLGVVPEDYSLNRFDSVFNSDSLNANSTPEGLVITGSAAKYLASEERDCVDKSDNTRPLICDTILDDDTVCSSGPVSPCDDGTEPKPPRRRKKKCGLIESPEDVFKFINQSNCFNVSIRKSSRGLGLAIFGGVDMSRLGPICQLIRIRKLYPLQPAVACGELLVGDVILEVNGLNMIGLTNTEALETLRVASNDVMLKIFRPDLSLMPPVTFFIKDLSPASSAMISPTSSASNTLKRPSTLNCGTNSGNTYHDVTLIKQEGTLGFSLFRYEKSCESDPHPSGIYVKALIRDPAISSGQIEAGDRILQVNGEDVSDCSRNDAVNLLRNASDAVTLKLYRFSEPLSPCSLEEIPHSKPLRIEARELLSDKARRKSDGNSASPRRARDRVLKRESVSSASSAESKNSCDVALPGPIHESPSASLDELPQPAANEAETPDVEVESSDENNMDLSASLNRNSRPKSLDLLCINEKKQNSVRSQVEIEDANQLFHRQASVVVQNSNDVNNEKQQIDEKGEGLLKWRGATLLSNEDNVAHLNLSLSTLSSGCQSPLSDQSQNGSNADLTGPPPPPRRLTSLQSWDSTPEETEEFLSSGMKLRKLYIQLDRGWQSRLGFSLGDQLPENVNCISPQVSSPVVTAVHSGSLAYKDGRIFVGDRLIEVNGESLLDKTAAEVIDLLRKTRGRVYLILLRVSSDSNVEPLI